MALGEYELELLGNIYRNAEMGRDGLYTVLRKTDDTAFRKLVATQLMEYQSIMDEAEELLQTAGYAPTGSPRVARMMVQMTACRKASQDNTPSALADMLIQGSCMGVTKIMKQITRYDNRSEECLDLARRLQKTEENNIHQMKQYL